MLPSLLLSELCRNWMMFMKAPWEGTSYKWICVRLPLWCSYSLNFSNPEGLVYGKTQPGDLIEALPGKEWERRSFCDEIPFQYSKPLLSISTPSHKFLSDIYYDWPLREPFREYVPVPGPVLHALDKESLILTRILWHQFQYPHFIGNKTEAHGQWKKLKHLPYPW